MTAIWPAGPPKLKAATRSQTFSASAKRMPCARGAAGEGFGVVDMDVACGGGLSEAHITPCPPSIPLLCSKASGLSRC